jgi:CHASE1-domain containing sensor protein
MIKWGLTAIMALGGPLLGLLVFILASSSEKEKVSAQFGEYVSEQQSLFQKEVNTVVEELYYLRSYFQLQDEINRQEFQALAQDALARHPAIRSLAWVPRITAGKREMHELQARKEGLTGYRILALRQNGDHTQAPSLAEHYPVFYVEPFEPNKRDIGLDLASEPVRRTALVEAMILGKIALDRKSVV